MKRIALLGSTGSIGTQTLDVVRANADKLRVFALTAHSNIDLLEEQVREFRPEVVGVTDSARAAECKRRIASLPTRVCVGEEALRAIAVMDGYDTFVSATVGLTVIRATLDAIAAGKNIALANKETLVAAGEIVMRAAREHHTTIIPIDSEHSALLQCLNGEKRKTVESLIVTCSGGALRDKTREELEHVSVADALGHKTWTMGRKITIDSATLMNKGFEVIEAVWLYDVPPERVRVVIHPESLIHSMVEYTDGSIMAQISEPDMRLPIQYALSYPDRWERAVKPHVFDRPYTFAAPDTRRFPCLRYAFDAIAAGGTMPAAMNAANDALVARFLAGTCAYMDIPRTIKKVMDAHTPIAHPTLDDIERTIAWATDAVEEFVPREK